MVTTHAPAGVDARPATVGPFRNEPPVDFTREDNVRKMRAAIEKVHAELGREYDLVIGGHRTRTAEKIKSINPAKPSEVVGVFQKAGKAEVEPAMQAALKAFETWSRTPIEERVDLLFRVGHIIRERKFEFMAWLVFEVGKNYAEADGDIAELIDFCEFYAREALRLSKVETPVQLPGERDMLRYIPLGVGIVIPPWNFPAAIMGGMTLASIVCGNTVILKPSSDSPTIAAKFFEALEEAGMPAGVVNFCPGAGGSFGDALVSHPKTRYIAFTGSREVGLHINKAAAEVPAGQIWIKRTILEMGGKDAIVVDADADLDAAVEGVAAAAFGFTGQKCSACSRAIVDERVYDKFVERLRDRVEKITVGDPAHNANMGPLNRRTRAQNFIFVLIEVWPHGVCKLPFLVHARQIFPDIGDCAPHGGCADWPSAGDRKVSHDSATRFTSHVNARGVRRPELRNVMHHGREVVDVSASKLILAFGTIAATQRRSNHQVSGSRIRVKLARDQWQRLWNDVASAIEHDDRKLARLPFRSRDIR